jgi:hypothetical protein
MKAHHEYDGYDAAATGARLRARMVSPRRSMDERRNYEPRSQSRDQLPGSRDREKKEVWRDTADRKVNTEKARTRITENSVEEKSAVRTIDGKEEEKNLIATALRWTI